MITLHKWTCQDCDTKLFLRLDDSKIELTVKLGMFEAFVTKHCIEKNHQVVHKSKGEFQLKYV